MADGRAVVRIVVAGHPCDVIIDTGLDSGVSLPDVLAPHLNLSLLTSSLFQLGTGVRVQIGVYAVKVEIDGHSIQTDAVYSTSTEVLLGVKALADFRLTIDYPAGTVTLERTRP